MPAGENSRNNLEYAKQIGCASGQERQGARSQQARNSLLVLVLVLVLDWGERGTCRESPTCCDPSTGQTHLQEPATPKPFEDEDEDDDEDDYDMPQRPLLAPRSSSLQTRPLAA